MNPEQDPNEQANISGADLAIMVDEIKKLKADAAKNERRAQEFSSALANHIFAMQAAVIEFRLTGKAEDAIRWIENTLAGPGFYPDIGEAEKMGGAQAWFDAKTAEENARISALREPSVIRIPADDTEGGAL